MCDAFESEESRGGKKRPDPCESCLKAFLQTEHHEPAASYVGGERESYREIQSEMLRLSFRPPKSYTRPNFESGSCIFSGGNAMLANDIGVQLPNLPYRHVVMRMGEMETQPLKFTVIAPARYTSTTFSSGGAVTCPFPTSQARSTIRVLSICTLSVGESFFRNSRVVGGCNQVTIYATRTTAELLRLFFHGGKGKQHGIIAMYREGMFMCYFAR